ncbi:MAG: hypothetical protein J6T09_03440, partial [Bacteroidales bacterium]|nr:hypothetical protein [Bacteroidales bacterium]
FSGASFFVEYPHPLSLRDVPLEGNMPASAAQKPGGFVAQCLRHFAHFATALKRPFRFSGASFFVEYPHPLSLRDVPLEGNMLFVTGAPKPRRCGLLSAHTSPHGLR